MNEFNSYIHLAKSKKLIHIVYTTTKNTNKNSEQTHAK